MTFRVRATETRVRQRPGGLFAELRRIRIDSGMGQLELSKKIGVERDQLSTWECGRTQPLFGNVEAWANALGFKLKLEMQT